MNILVVSATAIEVENFKVWVKNSVYESSCSFLITGPGIHSSSFKLGHYLAKKQFDLLIQAGIAGSFHDRSEIGKVYQITEEFFADAGAMDHDHFLDFFSLGLLDPNAFPYKGGKLINPNVLDNLPIAKGITVNCASGDVATIGRLCKDYGADLESMEGASFFHIALSLEIPFYQIRAISNFIEPRNRESWNLPLAIKNLNEYLIDQFPKFHTRSL